MLQIDLKVQNKKPLEEKPEPNPAALNQYNSLNRAQRIKSLARIVEDNRQMLGRLQTAKTHYNNARLAEDFDKQQSIQKRILANSDRFTKNPYFLHSVCTTDAP